jgi:hypothetical protein
MSLRLRLAFVACLGAIVSTPAMSQDADAVMRRAEQINGFLALLDHEDPSVRVAAMEEGLRSEDRVLRNRAIEAGYRSKDAEIRSMAIVRHLSSKPLVMLDLPEGVPVGGSARDWADQNLPAKFTLDGSGSWDSKNFSGRILTKGDGGGSSRSDVRCQIAGGQVKCVSTTQTLVLAPTQDGAYTGTLNGYPVVYRYK